MNERLGFLRSIIDAPDDDMSRLAFADWLQEHDEAERGELIRVQCELARYKPRPRLHLFAVSLREEPKFNKDKFTFREGPDQKIKIETFVTGDVILPPEEAASTWSHPLFDLPVGQQVFYGAVLMNCRSLGDPHRHVHRCEFKITGHRQENDSRIRELFVREAELLTENVGLRWAVKELAPTGWFKSGAQVRWWRWRRGFVEELRCPSAEFFDFVDKLYWRKSRECGFCLGKGWVIVRGKGHKKANVDVQMGCKKCGGCEMNPGTGILPEQPCPETAQPIRKVTFPDVPQLSFTGDGHFTWEGYPCRVPLPNQAEHPMDTRGLEHCLEATFPGIEFKVGNE